MHKKIRFLIILFLSLSFGIPNAYAVSKPSVSAYSALVVDYYSGQVLYSKNRTKRILPASTVKLLTAMVALDNLPISQKVGVSRKAALSPASKIFIQQGETYTVGDLVKAIVMASANDASVALAEAVSGTELAFTKKMNQKAKELGCRNSNFSNASGLPDKNMFTTATDMSHIMRAAFQYPFIRNCLESRYRTIYRPSGGKIRLKNHNKLLKNYAIEVYGKTGYTRAARHCFMSVAQYRKKRVLVLIFKSTSNWSDVRKLAEYGVGYTPHSTWTQNKIYKNQQRLKKSEVYKLQKALKRAGFSPGGIDGIFGKRTLNATIKFQKHYQLVPDGIVGPKTWGKLKRFM